jgi:hypothetical protein
MTSAAQRPTATVGRLVCLSPVGGRPGTRLFRSSAPRHYHSATDGPRGVVFDGVNSRPIWKVRAPTSGAQARFEATALG